MYFIGVKTRILPLDLSTEYLTGEPLNLVLFPINFKSSFFNLTNEFNNDIYFIIVGTL